jgi:excisionase family DNA binding protein
VPTERLQLHQPAPPPDGDAPGPAAQPVLLLTAPEAARALAISERTLWGLTDRGEVPCVRIGRAVRYALADLAAYIERMRERQLARHNGRPS